MATSRLMGSPHSARASAGAAPTLSATRQPCRPPLTLSLSSRRGHPAPLQAKARPEGSSSRLCRIPPPALSSSSALSRSAHCSTPPQGPWVSQACRAGNKDFSQEVKMREEVISPFRTLRMFLYIGFLGSAGVGTLVALVRLLGVLAGAPGDGVMSTGLGDIAQDLGIDVAALLFFGVLYRADARAKDAQMAKLAREESLSQLRVELSSGRMVKVAQLRGACRLVIVAGPLSHVQRALALAEPQKQELLERGVTVVPLVTEEDVDYSSLVLDPRASSSSSTATGSRAKNADYRDFVSVVAAEAAASKEAGEGVSQGSAGVKGALEDERWLARPLYTNEWDGWLKEQLKFANVDSKTPVYLSLRLDGRVRGSGVGFPRWKVIAAQLPPMKGMWRGPFDGMDGRVF